MNTAEKRKLSVSQVNTWERCAYRWKLERVDKAWQQSGSLVVAGQRGA